MAIVAISRALGSRGTEIAQGVANALGVPAIHAEVARHVSDRWCIDIGTVCDLKSALQPRFPASHSFADTLVCRIRQSVIELACQAPGAVFRGWGAAQFLKRVPHVVCVYVGAPFQKRCRRLQSLFNCGRRAAESRIAADDRLRKRLVRDHAGCEWTDADNYDASINTGRMSIEDAVAQIVALARSRDHAESERSLRILQDLRCETATRAALLNDGRTRSLRLFLRARNEALYVAGIVDNGSQRESVLEVVARANPRMSITSNLRAPSDYRTRTSSI